MANFQDRHHRAVLGLGYHFTLMNSNPKMLYSKTYVLMEETEINFLVVLRKKTGLPLVVL